MPAVIETYDEAVAFLLGRVDYERAPPQSRKPFRLDRTRRLLAALGDPQERIPVVHVAGTKGKGSTCTMLAAALTACGFRTGLFTSPHRERVEERFVVDGRLPTERELIAIVRGLAEAIGEDEPPTFFELLTAAGWMHFERERVDIAVLEVGLGGRLDATNVCRPEVTVITNVSLDHTAILGNHPREIAAEKAGIVKPDVLCLSGVDDADAATVVETRCGEQSAPLWRLGDEVRIEAENIAWAPAVRVTTPSRTWPSLAVPLAGRHQARNAALVLGALDGLAERGWNINVNRAVAGLEGASLPLRIEVLRREPFVICDAAHNEASIRALVATLEHVPREGRRVAVFGTSRDKDHGALLAALAPAFDEIVLTRYVGNPRGTEIDVLAATLRRMGHDFRTAVDPGTAWRSVEESVWANDLVCITGSFFLAAEMRAIVRLDDDRSLDGSAPG